MEYIRRLENLPFQSIAPEMRCECSFDFDYVPLLIRVAAPVEISAG
jgi:hypothetical protein